MLEVKIHEQFIMIKQDYAITQAEWRLWYSVVFPTRSNACVQMCKHDRLWWGDPVVSWLFSVWYSSSCNWDAVILGVQVVTTQRVTQLIIGNIDENCSQPRVKCYDHIPASRDPIILCDVRPYPVKPFILSSLGEKVTTLFANQSLRKLFYFSWRQSLLIAYSPHM